MSGDESRERVVAVESREEEDGDLWSSSGYLLRIASSLEAEQPMNETKMEENASALSLSTDLLWQKFASFKASLPLSLLISLRKSLFFWHQR